MFQFAGCSSRPKRSGFLSLQERGFPHSEICGSKVACHLTAAYRRLLRPSSSSYIKASAIYSYCDFLTLLSLKIKAFFDILFTALISSPDEKFGFNKIKISLIFFYLIIDVYFSNIKLLMNFKGAKKPLLAVPKKSKILINLESLFNKPKKFF